MPENAGAATRPGTASPQSEADDSLRCLGRRVTSRIERSDSPLLSRAANPRKTKGNVSAMKAKIEKPVAVVFSTSKTLKPSTQKNW